MTDREKAVVMAYTGFAMLTGEKLDIFYAYVREILGRPVWTHELAIKEVSAEIHEKSEKDFLELCASEDPKELPCQDETGMDERAVKVCNGLICHVNGHPHTRCHKCPYWGTGPHGSSECSVLAADALALIRQQQERIKELETAGQVPVKYPTCGCCGKEIDHINTSVFNYDGSDSDVSIPVLQEPSGGGVSFDTNRNWTSYELTDEERKDDIRCPFCGKYPFDRNVEIELFEPVSVLMWPVSKNPAESHDI